VACVWGWASFRDETNVGSGPIKINPTWMPFVRFIIPVAVGLVLLSGLALS
jgi:SNF family Na+-dependent transporter